MDPKSNPIERMARINPLLIKFTMNVITGLKPEPNKEKLFWIDPNGSLKKVVAIYCEKPDRKPKQYSSGKRMITVRILKKS